MDTLWDPNADDWHRKTSTGKFAEILDAERVVKGDKIEVMLWSGWNKLESRTF